MRKKALRLVPLMMMLCLGHVMAHPVDMRTVREVAVKFVNANTKTPLRGTEDLQLVTTYHTESNDAAFHIFNTPNGFIIISADDCATPILGYSDEGRPFDMDNIPIQLQDYLQGFVEQIQYGVENHIEDETIAQQWLLVRTTGRLNQNRDGEAVEPLVTALWGQGCYYNAMCPEDSNGVCGHTKVGCMATAMGMLMHYWGFPTHGNGSHSYTPYNIQTQTFYPGQTVNFGTTTYDWNNMPDQLTESSTQAEIDAVSTLLWHCGVAVDMAYGADESESNNLKGGPALSDYFNYHHSCGPLCELGINEHPTFEAWTDSIKNNLDRGHPLLYLGFPSDFSYGHAWVCDGYDESDLLHFNWGWSGAGNGYFTINPLLTVFNYQFELQQALFDVYPRCDTNSTIQITAFTSDTEAGYVIGGGTFGCQQECTLTAVANEGYQFISWTGDLGQVVSVDPSISFWAIEDRILEAHFADEENVCTLVFDLYDSFGDGWQGNGLDVNFGDGTWERLTFGEGSFSSLSRKVVDASHIQLYWWPGTNWDECSFVIRFENGAVIYEGVSEVEGLFLSDGFDLNCEDQYTLRTITVQIDPVEAGIVTGSGVYSPGDTCTLLAVPNEGYDFACWSENGVDISTDTIYSFIIGITDRDLTAKFGPFHIGISSNLSEGGNVLGGGFFNYGDTCTLTAVTNEGYLFLYWTENDIVVSFNPNYSFEVNNNRDLVACFDNGGGTGLLNGVFSVGPNKRVGFSKGNLLFQASTKTWRFADNQFDYVGSENCNVSSDYKGWIDLFGWGTSGNNHGAICYQPWSTNLEESEYYAYGQETYNLFDSTRQADWGYNAVQNGGNVLDIWRTFTEEEWNYLFTRNTTSGLCYVKAVVNGVNGVMLFPDDWDVSLYSFNGQNNLEAAFSDNTINNTAWQLLESNGAVFLPVTGGRMISWVYWYNTQGNYWSSSCSEDGNIYATSLSFGKYHVFVGAVSRSVGHAVRLVQDIYHIETETNLNNCGTVTGSGTYNHGATATLTATPNKGYAFLNWTKDNEVVSTEATYSFTVTESATYVANFSLDALHFTAAGTWSESSNWQGNALPGADAEVFIDAPCQLDQNATVAALTVSEGQSITLQSGKTLTVTGDLTNTVTAGLVIEDGAQLVHNVDNVQATVKKFITPFSNSGNGWHLIAMPLTGSLEVESVDNLLEGEYDLYGYDESTAYWMNSKHPGDGITALEAAKGYLYASGEEVTLEFAGTLENGSATITVPLSYTDEADFSGFNLVGNPFPCNATLDRPYYVMNADGTGINSEPIPATTPIPPCTAVFVKAEAEGETVEFTRVMP